MLISDNIFHDLYNRYAHMKNFLALSLPRTTLYLLVAATRPFVRRLITNTFSQHFCTWKSCFLGKVQYIIDIPGQVRAFRFQDCGKRQMTLGFGSETTWTHLIIQRNPERPAIKMKRTPRQDSENLGMSVLVRYKTSTFKGKLSFDIYQPAGVSSPGQINMTPGVSSSMKQL